jgi:hypothetical protein
LQSRIVAQDNTLQLIVYYEVPEGKRDKVKRKEERKTIRLSGYF